MPVAVVLYLYLQQQGLINSAYAAMHMSTSSYKPITYIFTAWQAGGDGSGWVHGVSMCAGCAAAA
jgi:hypothetical protein